MITAMPRIAIATTTADFGAAIELFGDVFAMPVADFSDSTVPSLGAHVGMCQPDGGSNIELMAPATPGLPLSDAPPTMRRPSRPGVLRPHARSARPRRRGRRAPRTRRRGAPVDGRRRRSRHPPPLDPRGPDPDSTPDGSVAQPAEPRAGVAGLSGIARAIVATDDAVKAADAYGPDGLGLAVGDPTDDPDRGVRSVIVTPPGRWGHRARVGHRAHPAVRRRHRPHRRRAG